MGNDNKKNWLEKWVSPIAIILIPIATAIILYNQNQSEIAIKDKQNKLFALQSFKDKLTGDRVTREATLKTIELLDDTNLTNKLREISDVTTIKMLKDSIWSLSSGTKENAIIEYAQLYKNKKYRSLILDALIPDYYHLRSWDVLISITKFFYYLNIVSDGKWYGTEKDWQQFAKIETSKWYKEPYAPFDPSLPYRRPNNIPVYFQDCRKNFVLDTTLNYKGTGYINLIRFNYGN